MKKIYSMITMMVANRKWYVNQSNLRLSLITVLMSICISTFADERFKINGLWYKITSSSTVTLQGGGGNRTSGDIVIPETVDYGGNTYRVTSISTTAFGGCEGIKSVTIPNSVTSIGKQAFDGCGFSSITIPNSVEIIDDHAFYYCRNLTTVVLPNSVVSFGEGTFSHCVNLSSVSTIHATEFNLGNFSDCPKLKELTLGEEMLNVRCDDEELSFNHITFLGKASRLKNIFFIEKLNIKELEVPYGSTLDYLQNYGWDSVPIIYSVNNGYKYYPIIYNVIGERCVSLNGKLDGIEVREDENVEIKRYNSSVCHSLIMKGTQDISTILSENRSYIFKPLATHQDNAINVYEYPLTDITLSQSGTLLDRLNLDDIQSVQNLKITGEINGTDFLVIRKMENLKLLDLKDAHIVDGGMPYFNNYTTKKNIIGKQLFCSMNKLLKVSLPSDIELISGNVFDNCKELRTLSIPKSVKSIGDCFNLCYNLHSIHIEDLTAYCTIDFSPYNFTDFASKYIDLYLNNEKIIDLVIPEGLSVISEYAFKSVRGINSLTIPTSITSIGKFAFDCPINKYIICRNPTPPEISEVTFTNETYRATTLYVPKGSKTLFWLHPCWGKFVNIIEMDATSINNITKDQFPKNKGVYTVNGIKLSDDADNIEILPKGIYVINGKKVIIK